MAVKYHKVVSGDGSWRSAPKCQECTEFLDGEWLAALQILSERGGEEFGNLLEPVLCKVCFPTYFNLMEKEW